MVLTFLILIAHLSNGFSEEIQWYLTNTHTEGLIRPNYKLQLMPVELFNLSSPSNNAIKIEIDVSSKYQSLYGIGSSLESSTAYNLMKLGSSTRQKLLESLFSKEKGIGFNLMRITIGTSDFCPAPFYSYDDNGGIVDEALQNFSTLEDEKFIIPAIQESIAVASASEPGDNLRFFASPWSSPGWMKKSGILQGGELLSEYHSAYTNYLSKFISTYRDKYGINISAITPQNEPLANQTTYPSILFPPNQEKDLIRDNLGQAMKNLGVDIWCFDHNWDTLFYPETILKDRKAASFVTGTGFHGYKGQPSAMTELHNKFPDKDIFFTEGSMFGIRGAKQIIDILRNWSRSYSAWVTILDTDLQPNSGPFHPQPTMIQIDSKSLDIIYNDEYYIYGHFSKFLPRGSIRIESSISTSSTSTVSHVAFLEPVSNKIILIVVNEEMSTQTIEIANQSGLFAQFELPARSVATFLWPN